MNMLCGFILTLLSNQHSSVAVDRHLIPSLQLWSRTSRCSDSEVALRAIHFSFEFQASRG